jgi:type II secretory pathway pseudopilin PulG
MNKKGETLLEVLIALTLITVSSAAAASAIISSTQSLYLSKNYIVAQNLASEGIEIVKNIRDTNWMKFSQNTQQCWLNIQNIDLPSDCPSAEKFTYNASPQNFYAVNFDDESGKWMAEKVTNSIDINPIPNAYALVNSGGKYVEPGPSVSPSFYRAITITGGDGTTNVTVQSIVKWYEGSRLYSVTGMTALNNYTE